MAESGPGCGHDHTEQVAGKQTAFADGVVGSRETTLAVVGIDCSEEVAIRESCVQSVAGRSPAIDQPRRRQHGRGGVTRRQREVLAVLEKYVE